MIKITFPDGRIREYQEPVTAGEIAMDISEGFARKALAAEVNGRVVDLSDPIAEDARVRILTFDTDEGREVFWHSSTHIMAQAVKRLWPEAKLEDGPPTDAGFFYDILFPEPISEDDFQKIEDEMKKIIKENLPVVRKKATKEEAKALFGKMNEDFKLPIIEEIPEGDPITVYTQGEFSDLCRGPHIPSTGKVKAIKLLSIAGSYYKGDSDNLQLQRLKGVSFPDKKLLKEHLAMLEEARKRDHRRIGQELELFHFSPAVGGGLPLWLPKGTIIREELMSFLHGEQKKRGYQFVVSPHIGNLELYKTSGHYPYYKDSQFAPILMDGGESFLLKPMNCPHHHQIYASKPRSYRDLPLRLAEFGTVYRYEQSGEVHGLTRVRGFTQDDAHIYTTNEQLKEEIRDTIELTQLVSDTFNLDIDIRLSFRDDQESKYGGDLELWERAQQEIKEVADEMGLDYFIGMGEASFYGPKVDFIVRDALRRKWQLGTVQVDYVMPERFDLTYVGADGQNHRPVIIHRAPFGSFERFIAMLIEHFAGDFPLWIAPVQVVVLPITTQHLDYAKDVADALTEAGVRVEVDDRSEKTGYKIRDAELKKIPYMLIVGDKERENGSVSVRRHKKGDQGAKPLQAFIGAVSTEIRNKVLD